MTRIRFLERKDIDVERWDRCVTRSTHGDVYALSGWLDIMAKRWSGLVQDDYTAVLPIPWNRKYLLKYIYTPRFTSPLPLCENALENLPLEAFLSAIPKTFVLWDLDIKTIDDDRTIPYKHHLRTNFLLNLKPGYDALFSQFRPKYRNLIRNSMSKGFIVQKTKDFSGIIQLAAQKKKISGMKPEDYKRFTQLCIWLEAGDMLESWESLSPSGKRSAGAVFVRSDRKLYYLLAWNNEEGRKNAASHLLMHEVIANHAGSGLILDFEGSDNPAIAHFMRGFGANASNYIHIRKPFSFRM